MSWKVYSSPDGNFGDNVLPYFKQYWSNPALGAKATTPSFPGTFQADVAAGTLPQVSWVLAPLLNSEHPPAPRSTASASAAQVLQTLVSNPAVWAKTALFITYDENGGFFDHVPPPSLPRVPRASRSPRPLPADGQRRRAADRARLPRARCSSSHRSAAAALCASDTFDHTSTLRFLESRFGAECPT